MNKDEINSESLSQFSLYVLVIITDRKCEDSETLNCIEAIRKHYGNQKFKLILFDNSSSDLGNEDYCKKRNYSYYTLRKDMGLSKAYNYVINRLEKEGYILIFDDDTEFDFSFIEQVQSAISKIEDVCIYVPVVRVKLTNEIMSPHDMHSCTPIHMPLDITRHDNLTAINSGMVINLKVFNKFRYNENLFLDCVDHCFMRDARKNHIPIKILPVEIRQNFSGSEKKPIASALERYRIFRRDLYQYTKICDNRWFYYAHMIKRTLSQTIKYKTFKFVKALLEPLWTPVE